MLREPGNGSCLCMLFPRLMTWKIPWIPPIHHLACVCVCVCVCVGFKDMVTLSSDSKAKMNKVILGYHADKSLSFI